MKTHINIQNFKFFAPVLLTTALLTTLAGYQITKNRFFIRNEPRVLGEFTETARGSNSKQNLQPAKKTNQAFAAENISAKAFLVIDEASQTILMEKNPHEKLPIASLTKLMTALIAYEKLDPGAFYKITEDDILNTSPALNLTPGEEVRLMNLLEAAIVCSANDAARALANAVHKNSAENFLAMMNRKAALLGLTETNFANPLGFDNVLNFSSANDLEKLAFYTQKLGIFKNLGKRTEISFASKSGKPFNCLASNKLVKETSEIQNIKTGYTAKALGSMIIRATRGGKSLLVILIASKNRERDSLALMNLAFENYAWK